MTWRHERSPNMILCVEQDGVMDMFERNSDLHHVLLVGEAGNPEDLYPFDDVCSYWAAGWQGGLPTENPSEEGSSDEVPAAPD